MHPGGRRLQVRLFAGVGVGVAEREIGEVDVVQKRGQHVVGEIFHGDMPFDRSDRKVIRACLALRLSDRTDADAQRARPLKVRIVGLGDGDRDCFP